MASAALHRAIQAAGVSDAALVDGSVVAARIYCCGGVSRDYSAEYANSIHLYVPPDMRVGPGDFVEFKAGRPPEQGDSGRLNTVIRIVARRGDQPETCWWDPRNPKLWLRVVYCTWMPREGWVRQGGIYPAWYKPAG